MKLQRYGSVDDGIIPREVVLLRSMPCSWGKCEFCEYKNDNVPSVATAIKENLKVLDQVQGKHGVLQVIDSASWTELPMQTLFDILQTCLWMNIYTVIFEGHWMYKDCIDSTMRLFNKNGIHTEYILGLESISVSRRRALKKGVPEFPLQQYRAGGFGWVNLLYGDTTSPSAERFLKEVKMCSSVFDYVNISIFTDNDVAGGNGIFREKEDVEAFYQHCLEPIKQLGNVFVFDYGDSRAPDTLGGVGNTI